jgi:hypothetical protein
MKQVFDREDAGDMFLLDAGWLSTDYVSLYPRKHNSSCDFNFIKFVKFFN